MSNDSEKYLVSEFDAKRIIHVEVQIYKSELRDPEVKDKFYAHIREYEPTGSYGEFYNTDDYDSIAKLKKGIKVEMEERRIEIKF